MASKARAKAGKGVGEGKGKPPLKARKAGKTPNARPVAPRGNGKWPRDPRNPFRPTSSYAACFDILAAHKDGLPRARLVELLAEATAKPTKLAAYDSQVLCSARPNENGLNNNDSPRHRSCRPGFWIKKENDHVRLMVD